MMTEKISNDRTKLSEGQPNPLNVDWVREPRAPSLGWADFISSSNIMESRHATVGMTSLARAPFTGSGASTLLVHLRVLGGIASIAVATASILNDVKLQINRKISVNYKCNSYYCLYSAYELHDIGQ
ncbi:hypothetical protein [Membranihabitans marinus]|uniref:hypothetical protein n=1 Tax=Membranihabitans marinus TaxID=1227546 RepID=UPI001F2CCC5B|nr:hypothetical protein [Membranihabitans marinus]